jgi:catechol 2,3-dioxygenase-like lactoylglutathione lyase family enzyme
MKIVPVIKSADLERSLRFYTEVLDFERKWPGEKEREAANGVPALN